MHVKTSIPLWRMRSSESPATGVANTMADVVAWAKGKTGILILESIDPLASVVKSTTVH